MGRKIGKLLLRISFLAAPLLLCFIFLEVGLSRVENSYTLKKRLLHGRLKTIQVLVLGSSHAYYGIDPSYFTWKGFNLADVSQSLRYDNALLRRYAPRCPELKVVLMAVSDFSLGYGLTDSGEYWREFFYARTYGIPVEKLSMLFDARHYLLFALYGRKESFSYIRNGFKANLTVNVTASGSFVAPPPDPAKVGQILGLESARKEVAIHGSVSFQRNVAANRRFLEDSIIVCKDRGIVPVLLTTPTTQAYSSSIDPRVWRDVEETVKEMCARYGISYYNFMNDPRFLNGDFEDPDHLNSAGAKKLSVIVNHEILAHLLSPQN